MNKILTTDYFNLFLIANATKFKCYHKKVLYFSDGKEEIEFHFVFALSLFFLIFFLFKIVMFRFNNIYLYLK